MSENKNNIGNKISFLLSNKPSGTDLFEGKSHERIANQLSEILQTDDSCKIIGIDGKWGTGKSNIINILESKLTQNNYHFFVYDAWGYQEDLQRRSILEALTASLQKSIFKDKETWENKLEELLGKKIKSTTKTVPKLSIGLILSILVLLFTPLLTVLAGMMNDRGKMLIAILPIVAILLLIIYFIFKEKSLGNGLAKAFYIYQDRQIENVVHETISEEEPTVREFRKWMTDISTDIGDQKLILVFDNMDRLPTDKVRQLWSSIHLFFAETSYNNISVIIPFDRQHIINAFKNEDGADEKCYGNDFIDKTFNVVYRVSLPILTDWRAFFEEKVKEAFNEKYNKEEWNRILQIYGLLCIEITPRKIIAFINEVITLKQVEPEIPESYIALFILGKDKILASPIEEIINPTYLGATTFLYKEDENLPKYIAALVYQLDPDTAMQIIYNEKLKLALERKDVEEVELIAKTTYFLPILNHIFSSLDNIPNVIECLYNIDFEFSQSIWDDLYKKINKEDIFDQKIQSYQLYIIEKITDKKNYINYLFSSYVKTLTFDINNYYESIEKIKSLCERYSFNFSIFDLLKEREVSSKDFVILLEKAKKDFSKYKLTCSSEEIDKFLSEQNPSKLSQISYVPYLISENYTLDKYKANLKTLIQGNVNDKDILCILLERWKEVINYKPFGNNPLLTDKQITDLFEGLDSTDQLYYDLIAMRISRYTSFQEFPNRSLNSILDEENEEIVIKLIQVIQHYTSYGDLLLNLVNFSDKKLYKKIVKSLLGDNDKYVGIKRLNIYSIIEKFDEICNAGDLNIQDFIEDLNGWKYYKEERINLDNINTIIHNLQFFKYAQKSKNELSLYCINTAVEYLNSLSEEEWITSFKDEKSILVGLSVLLDDYTYSTSATAAIKSLLRSIHKEELEIPDTQLWKSILLKVNKESKYTEFKTIVENYCTNIQITPQLFMFFGEWLFEYGRLTEHPKTVRRILSEVIKSDECRKLISKYSSNLKTLIKNTDSNELEDFKSTVRTFLDKDDEYAKIIAKEIGVRKSRKKEKVTE